MARKIVRVTAATGLEGRRTREGGLGDGLGMSEGRSMS